MAGPELEKPHQDSVQLCFWCSSPAPDTKDHVFPRCLFPNPMPPDVISLKVAACRRHNGAFSRDEEYFRDFILSSSYGHRQAREIWDTKTVKALTRSPKYRAMLAKDVYDVDVSTPAGIVLGQVSVITANAARINLVLRKILTGLYYHDYGEVLGFPTIGVHQILRREDFALVKPAVDTLPLRRLGHITFRFGRASDSPRATLGGFFFFDRVLFVVYSDPRDGEVPDPLAATTPRKSRLWFPERKVGPTQLMIDARSHEGMRWEW